MKAQKCPRFALIALSLCLAQLSCPPLIVAAKSKSAKSKHTTVTVSTDADEATAVKAQMTALSNSLSRAEAKSLASLWTEDGNYVDEDGSEFKGRAALEKRFDSVFSTEGKQQVEFVTGSLRPLASNVMLAEGVVRRQEGGSQPEPQTRYTIVFVKQNGTWLISNATESPYLAKSTINPLEPLSWMVGDWSADSNGGFVHMKAEWTANNNFITCNYQTKKSADAPVVDSRQVIGWDPRTQQPVSWNFDTNGGFSYGDWIRKDGQWLVKATGVERDGSVSSSTNIISVSSPNSFSWQSVNRTVDGITFSDTAPLKVQRVTR